MYICVCVCPHRLTTWLNFTSTDAKMLCTFYMWIFKSVSSVKEMGLSAFLRA